MSAVSEIWLFVAEGGPAGWQAKLVWKVAGFGQRCWPPSLQVEVWELGMKPGMEKLVLWLT